MNRMTKYLLYLCMLTLMNHLAHSQSDSLDIYDFDFKQLSNLKIITASKAPQNIREVPSTIFVITASDITEKGYFTLEEALSDLPGFQFRNILGINSYVFQRGIPNQNNLILLLIDGIQVNELNSGGFYGGGQYNLNNVERIEVVYGPASVAYGTNAVSGIVNIITKSAIERQVEINSLTGTFNTAQTDLSYCLANKKKKLGIRLSGMYKQSDKANLKGRAGDYNWTDLMDNFEHDYSLDLKIQADHFLFGSNLLQKQTSTATLTKSAGTTYRDYGTLWNIRFINNYLKYNKKLSKSLDFSSTLYNRNTTVLDNTVYYVVDTAQIGYYRPNNLSGFENILSYDVNHLFAVTGGLMLEYEQLAHHNTFSYSTSPEEKPPIPEKPAMDNNSLMSIFCEPRLTLLKHLYLSGGIRFDQSSIYHQVFTPRAGISYSYNNQIVRFSYAQAFRAPKPWDYSDGLGNTSLLPEEMQSLEAGVSLSIFNNYKINLVGYKNKLENAITKDTINRWINQGEVNTTGFEINFSYSGTNRLKSSLNYTYNQSINEHRMTVPEISKHCANASIIYSFNKHIKLNLRANYLGNRKNPKTIITTNSTDVGPYLVFHGALSFLNYQGFSIQLSCKNIFNQEYYHTSNRTPDRYRQPQRTLMLSVGYSLK